MPYVHGWDTLGDDYTNNFSGSGAWMQDFPQETGALKVINPESAKWWEARSGEAMWVLHTGLSVAGGQNAMSLMELSASAAEQEQGGGDFLDWGTIVDGANLPGPDITVMGQALDTNYLTYVALPDGATVNAPIEAATLLKNKSGNQTKYTPVISWAGGSAITNAQNVIVGQKISLTCGWQGGGGPATTNFSWTVPGYAVSNFCVSTDIFQTNGYPIELSNETNGTVAFYWVDAGDKKVQCTFQVAGKTLIAQATFDVVRPAGKIYTQTGTVGISGLFGQTELGFINVPNYLTAGIWFSNTVTLPVESNFNWGNTNFETSWVQLIISPNPTTITTQTGTNTVVHKLETTGTVLDGQYPYPEAYPFNGRITVDAPFVSLAETNEVAASDMQTSKMWLMFKPAGGQWVPLRTVTWNWSGVATLSGTNWVLSAPQWSTNPPDADSGTTYPAWSNNAANTNAFRWNPAF